MTLPLSRIEVILKGTEGVAKGPWKLTSGVLIGGGGYIIRHREAVALKGDRE